MISSASDPIFPSRRGAISPYTWGLSREFVKKGHSVTIYGVGFGQLTEDDFAIRTMFYEKIIKSFHKSMSSLPINLPNVIFDLKLFREIPKLHKHSPIDVIHNNMPYSLGNFEKYFLRIPTFCSIHNQVRSTYGIRCCTKILPVSKYLQGFLLDNTDINPDKVAVLPIAVDTRTYTPKKTPETAKSELNLNQHPLILFVGRKCPEKGPQVLIKALSKVVKHYPKAVAVFIGPDYHFGSNTSTYTNQLIAAVSALGLKSNTLFLNFISQEKLLQFFNAADILVCPSVWQEPFGKVIIEALAFEKPTIASNVGGIPEIIDNGVNGLLVPPDKSGDLADAIISLLDNNELSCELGKRGRKTVEKHYSFETVAKQCLEIYKNSSK